MKNLIALACLLPLVGYCIGNGPYPGGNGSGGGTNIYNYSAGSTNIIISQPFTAGINYTNQSGSNLQVNAYMNIPASSSGRVLVSGNGVGGFDYTNVLKNPDASNPLQLSTTFNVAPNGYYTIQNFSGSSISVLQVQNVYSLASGSTGGGGGGSFSGTATNLTGNALNQSTNIALSQITAQNINAALPGVVTTNLPITPSVIYYVAPWGNDTNSGLSPYSPMQNLGYVSMNVATNPGTTIDLMPGDNAVMATGNTSVTRYVRLSSGVSLNAETGSILEMTNTSPGSLSSTSGFYYSENSFINNLHMIWHDSAFNNVKVIKPNNINAWGVTNVVFNNLYLKSDSGGFDFEGVSYPDQVILNNPTIIANSFCYNFEISQFLNVIINNPTAILTNWQYNGAVSKPFHAWELTPVSVTLTPMGGGFVTINGGVTMYSDSTFTNIPSCAIYCGSNGGSTLTNSEYTIQGMTIIPVGITNPGSFDIIGAYSNQFKMFNCSRQDGTPITETNYSGASAVVTAYGSSGTKQYPQLFGQIQSGNGSALTNLNPANLNPALGILKLSTDCQSNAWSLATATNGMLNFTTRFHVSSNGVPTDIYLSNGIPYFYNEAAVGGGIIP